MSHPPTNLMYQSQFSRLGNQLSPSATKVGLQNRFLRALEEAGCDVRIVGSQENPLICTATRDGRTERLRVYIWRLTHGGATRDRNEYRIQITGVDRILVDEHTRTLLLGYYYDEHGEAVFVAFDARKHLSYGASPSIQVKRGTFLRALSEGLFIEHKESAQDSNGQFSAAFVPSESWRYVSELHDSLHRAEPVREVVQAVAAAEEEARAFGSRRKRVRTNLSSFAGEAPDDPAPLPPLPEPSLPAERERRAAAVVKAIRDAGFRRRVLRGYGQGGCAICLSGHRLVEAAHIHSVAHGGSDAVTNGLPLCPTHHWAFDRGLLRIAPSGIIEAVDEAISAYCESEESALRFKAEARIGQQVRKPLHASVSPDAEVLRQAYNRRQAWKPPPQF